MENITRTFFATLSLILLQLSALPSVSAQERAAARVSSRVYFENGLVETGRVPVMEFPEGSALDSISVAGYASPAGKHTVNTELSWLRAMSVADTLALRHPGTRISYYGYGEYWDRLTELLEAAGPVYRDALPVLAEAAADKAIAGSTDELKQRLLAINDGALYREISKVAFPELRVAEISYYITLPSLEPEQEQEEPAVSEPTSTGEEPIRVAESEPVPKVSETLPEERFCLAFRTNLLAPLTNVGVELPLGRRVSIGADWYSPWLWPKADNKDCFEFQAADVYLRWWFAPRRIKNLSGNTLAGHSLSLVAYGGHYDFERDFHGLQGELYGGALEYAWAFPLGKRLRMELSLAAGVAYLPYRKYTVHVSGGDLILDDPYIDRADGWFGPVKAGVCLVLPLTSKSYEQ